MLDPALTRLFVSDLHLESADSVQFRRFVELLDAWSSRADGIYLLGDIAELWIGDDDDGVMAVALRDVLRRTALRSPVFLMHGNRDFLYGEALCRETGVQLLADPTPLPDGLLLAHGDAWCIDDAHYQQFRAMVRSPAWQRDVLGRTVAQRRALGEAMRAESRRTSANKAANIMDVNEDAVSADLRAHRCHSLVHGHTHRPGLHSLGEGVRMVLGSWDGRVGWYGLQQAGRLRLFSLSLAHRYETGSSDPCG